MDNQWYSAQQADACKPEGVVVITLLMPRPAALQMYHQEPTISLLVFLFIENVFLPHGLIVVILFQVQD